MDTNYDFQNDYKLLPIKTRVTLIELAKKLLKIQKDEDLRLSNVIAIQKEDKKYGLA